MAMRSVGQLREFLATQGISPEALAKATAISNMTLRRLLQKSDQTAIPVRYHLQLDAYEAQSLFGNFQKKSTEDFSGFMDELSRSGSEVSDIELLHKNIERKLNEEKSLGVNLREAVTRLQDGIKAERWNKAKTLALGALVYFLNPADLIPDAMPLVGFLDDFAVLSLVTNYLGAAKAPNS